ncbi:MAG: family 43 glycosylhydrolase [Erysipelotrichaceae bacterium]|nr:family 43 glycosylhydrolase [Erysipelotrichaceae bacterium]
MRKVFLCFILIISLFGCSKGNSFVMPEIAYLLEDECWKYDEVGKSMDVDLSNDFSISLWIKPEANKTGTPILTMTTATGVIEVTSSGYNAGVYSGITWHEGDVWIVADGIHTLTTGRFNQVVINRKGKEVTIYLNGKQIVSGTSSSDNISTISIGEVGNGYFSGLSISAIRSDEEVLNEYESTLGKVLLDTIKFKDTEHQVEDLWLVDYKLDETDVHFDVSDTTLMNFEGKIVRPIEKDSTVTLTARIATDKTFAEKHFDIQLIAENDKTLLEADLKALDAEIEGVMHSGVLLPNVLPNGTIVAYRVEGNASVVGNTLIKSEEGKQTITLTVEGTLNNETFAKSYEVVLLDEIYGYVMSYFNGELGEETGYYAVSTDGLHWDKVEGVKLTSELGSKRIRDPWVGRDKEGNFIILATEGFDNPEIYIFHSKDLRTIDHEQLVQVVYYDEGLKMTGLRAWAPEMTYDNENDLYYIYFSDNGFETKEGKSGQIVCVTTSDFETFSYPKSFLDTGYSIIDGTIFIDHGRYWMLYKDERKAAQTIYYGYATELSKGFNKVYDDTFLSLIKYEEGPFTFKSKEGKQYLYVDNYPTGKFYVGELVENEGRYVVNWLEDYQLPEEDVRHGSVIPITEEEYKKLMN